MVRTNDITSATEYRNNQRAFHSHIHDTDRPVFITNHGKTEAVLMSPRVYDEIQDLLELRDSLASIKQSEREFAEGKGIEAREGIRQIAEKLGLKLNR